MSDLVLQSTSVLNTLTEWCIFTPKILAEDFIRNKVKRIVDRVISDTLANCLNIDSMVESSLYTNTTDIVDSIGLKKIIIDTYLRASITYVKVEVVNDTIIYTKLQDYIVNKDPDNNILVINCKDSAIWELYDYYGLIFRYMIFANSVLELANKPIVKFNDYRTQNDNLASKDVILAQVRESLDSLKRAGGFAILDAKDQLDMFTIDITNYETLLTQAYNGIADTFGLSLSYFTGEIAGGLNSLGEGDRIKNQDAFYSLYKNMLQNVLKRVYDITNKKYEVVYKEYLEFKLKGILPILQALERTTLLTEEQKQQYITKLMD